MVAITPQTIKLALTLLLSTTGIIFYSLILASCTSSEPVISSLYLIEILNTRDPNSQTSFLVRTGYFGICTSAPSAISCSNSAQGAGSYANWHTAPAEIQPYIDLAIELQKYVFFPWLITISAVFFFIGAIVAVIKQVSAGLRPVLERTARWCLGISLVCVVLQGAGITWARNALALTTDLLMGTEFVFVKGDLVWIFHWVCVGVVTVLLGLSEENYGVGIFKGGATKSAA